MGVPGPPLPALVTNCILWDNTDGGGVDESAQIHAVDASINHSCVQGWTGDWGGTGNHGDDPMLVDVAGPDGIPGTEDEDLRLSPDSPCIDAGDNDAVPPDVADLDEDGDVDEPIPVDLDGLPRFVDDPLTADTGNSGAPGPPIVDLGAYEYQLPGDCDRNGQVNLIDFATLADCVGGPDFDVPAECDCPDVNLDAHVDLLDFAGLQLRFSYP